MVNKILEKKAIAYLSRTKSIQKIGNIFPNVGQRNLNLKKIVKLDEKKNNYNFFFNKSEIFDGVFILEENQKIQYIETINNFLPMVQMFDEDEHNVKIRCNF